MISNKIINYTLNTIDIATAATFSIAIAIGFKETDNDSKQLFPRTKKHLQNTHELLWNKCVKFHKKKCINILTNSLVKKYNISSGSLLKTKRELLFFKHIPYDRFSKQIEMEHVLLPKNSILLFLNIENEPKYDKLSVKVLVNEKILYFRKHEPLSSFIKNFDKNFLLLCKSNE